MSDPIYIVSFGRDRVLTWENLPPSLQNKAVVVLHPEHSRAMKDHYGSTLRVLETVLQGRGGPTIKQYILGLSILRCHRTVFILDDDLAFQYGEWKDGKKVFRRATDKVIEDAFGECQSKATERVGFTGLGSPFLNSHRDKWLNNKKGCYAICFNVQAAKLSKARFDEVPTMGDVHVCLGLATAGYESLIHSNLVVVDRSKSGLGGESAIADRHIRHSKAIDILSKKWPDYVRVRSIKGNKRHKENIGSERDVTILFSKAVKENLCRVST